ncbi:hypothetical protein HZB02_07740 [Candidatus Woesearchaeota archaeon]|nr:hypothetical protein [Candidatus Woesearchaeota archaeon]
MPSLLPLKLRIRRFNEIHLHLVEELVELLTPWLIFVLLFMLIGVFAAQINGAMLWMFGHASEQLAAYGVFLQQHHQIVELADLQVILFIVMDLYFKFFESPSLGRFLRMYFIDILAVLPLGWAIGRLSAPGRLGEEFITQGQQLAHVTADSEKIAAKEVRLIEKEVRATRVWYPIISRLQKLLRLARLMKPTTYKKKGSKK